MIFLSTGAYDPDEPEGSSSKSAYFSKRDLRNILIAIVVFLIISIPIYRLLKAQSQKYICKTRLEGISKAISLYMADWDNRHPPMADTGGEGLYEDETGRPFTWVSRVEPNMSARTSFVCPSAEPQESSRQLSGKTSEKTVVSTYGLYIALAERPLALIDRPDSTMLVAETCNHGARATFNPVPLMGPKGEAMRQDGFWIGYDTGNNLFNKQTRWVSRLAFYGTSSGEFKADKPGRHGEIIQGVTASGSLVQINASQAEVQNVGGARLDGLWATR